GRAAAKLGKSPEGTIGWRTPAKGTEAKLPSNPSGAVPFGLSISITETRSLTSWILLPELADCFLRFLCSPGASTQESRAARPPCFCFPHRKPIHNLLILRCAQWHKAPPCAS